MIILQQSCNIRIRTRFCFVKMTKLTRWVLERLWVCSFHMVSRTNHAPSKLFRC